MMMPNIDLQDLVRPNGADGSVPCDTEISLLGDLDGPRPLATQEVPGMGRIPDSASDLAFGPLSASLSLLGGRFSWEGGQIPQEPVPQASNFL